MNAESYIKDRLDDQIGWYDNKAGKMQKLYKFWQAAKLIIALLIPIATLFMDKNGGDGNKVFVWSIVIAGLGAAVILIEGLQKLYDYKDLWKKYRSTSEALRSEKLKFQAKVGPYERANDSFKYLVIHCEQIMNDENHSWRELMDEDDD